MLDEKIKEELNSIGKRLIELGDLIQSHDRNTEEDEDPTHFVFMVSYSQPKNERTVTMKNQFTAGGYNSIIIPTLEDAIQRLKNNQP